MASPVYINGFESQVISSQGSGLYSAVNGACTIDTSVFNTGAASCKIAPTGAASSNIRKTFASGNQKVVLSGYIRLGSGNFPSGNTVFFGVISATGTIFSGINLSTTGNIRCVTGSTAAMVSSSVTMAPDQWYLIDLLIDQSTTTWTVDWAIDGVSQTQVSAGSQTVGDISGLRIGSNTTAITFVSWVDDLIASLTPADYPIGVHGTGLLKPNADGTHNAGTNVMENQEGSDIGVVSAYSLIDDIPMSSASEYIRQAATGTGNYAEVIFSDLAESPESILGAMAILAHTSASTSSNNGGCIISKDNFSSQTTIHGAAGSLADYSDGSTSDVYYRVAIVNDADTLIEVNDLKARLGYSSDTNPNPYWVNLMVEVCYKPQNNIPLDIVSFSNTFNDINILVHEVIQLDLVTFSSIINDLNVVENGNTELDLVSFINTFEDINILVHEVVSLDLVSYTSTFNDIEIIVHEGIPLDLLSYDIVFNDIIILVHEVIILDLVSYSITYDDVSIIESEDLELDLVVYNFVFPDIEILESDVTGLDLVSYSLTFNDIEILIHEVISLELVTYSNDFLDINILEDGIIGLDLVSYSNDFNDITILESEIIGLDLVSWTSTYNDISMVEGEVIFLDLVSYSSTLNDLAVIESEIISLDLASFLFEFNNISILETEIVNLDLVTYGSIIFDIDLGVIVEVIPTPIERRYLILSENRLFAIGNEERRISVLEERREFLISQKEK